MKPKSNNMNMITRVRRKFAWMNMSTATLIALLQRTPVVRLVVAVDEMVIASPVGTILKSAAAAIAALGAVDTMAGATILASSITPNPTGNLPTFNATVGTAITPIGFTITNSQNVGSWKVTGQIPPGLELVAVENTSISLTGPGNLDATTQGNSDPWGGGSAGNSTTTPELMGTPTSAGTYTFNLQGFAGAGEMAGTITTGTGISAVFPFTVVVTAATTTPPPASVPVFATQPISVSVTGGTVALNAVASNSPTYQWNMNGSALPGATSSVLALSNAAASAGTYTCVATNSAGSTTSNAATVSITGTSDVGRLVNVSTRAMVGTGGNILILGFAVSGSGTESLLARGSGPALVPFGVTGTLPDPQLQLFNGSTVLATNNGWAGNATIASEASAVGAFAWSSPTSHDSALASSLGAGSYTLQIAGQSGDTGVALAELYDATPAGTFTASSPHLINLSARVQVGTGGNVLIAGFSVGGSAAVTVLIRASGPALVPFGVTGTLPDPELQLFSGSTVLASNLGWGGNSQISSRAAAVGAFAWSSPVSEDSALLVTLPPGPYTAQVTGASGDTGVALVEVYEVP
jgi:hypothetical protein